MHDAARSAIGSTPSPRREQNAAPRSDHETCSRLDVGLRSRPRLVVLATAADRTTTRRRTSSRGTGRARRTHAHDAKGSVAGYAHRYWWASSGTGSTFFAFL